MSNRNRKGRRSASEIIELGLRGASTKKSLPVENGKGKQGRGPGRAVVVLAIMIFAIAAVGAVASWRGLSTISTSRALVAGPLPTPPSMPASGPAREYVYAGSALVSTVEPFRQPPDDLAVWRPSDGTWYVLNAQQTTVTQQWGSANDVPAPGDFDGDGKTDFCVFRPSDTTWYKSTVQTARNDTCPTGVSIRIHGIDFGDRATLATKQKSSCVIGPNRTGVKDRIAS